MADEVLIAKFEAELAGVKKQLDDYIASLENVQKEEKDTQKETTKTAGTIESSAKKRNAAIKAELAELTKLKAARKQAFTPEEIDKFNRKIAETQNRISTLRGGMQTTGAAIKQTLAGIGAGILAAFSIQAVTAFGKASVNAFLEAEESAHRLEFAVTQIAGEAEIAFERLIRQSAQLQQVSIFSDESIQGAQAALATFGLMSDQIEELIPRILDFASAAHTDLSNATDTFLRALEGQTRGLVTAGLKFEDTGTKIGNYNQLLKETATLTGATEAVTHTLVGELTQLDNRADELQETVGEKLAPAWVALKVATFEATIAIIDYFKNFAANQFVKFEDVDKQAEAFKKVTKAVLEQQEALKKAGFDQAIASREAIKNVRAEINERLALEIDKAKAVIADKDAILPEKQLAELKVRAIRDELNAVLQLAKEREQIDQVQAQRSKDTLTEAELRLKKEIELQQLLKENIGRPGVVFEDNVKLINAEIEARKKLKDQADVRIAGSAEEIKLLSRIGAEYSALFTLLNDEQKVRLLDLQLTGEKDLIENTKNTISQIEELLKINGVEIPITPVFDKDGNLNTIQDRLSQLKSLAIEVGIILPDDSKEKIETIEKLLESKGVEIPLQVIIEGEAEAETLQRRIDQLKKTAEDNKITLAFDIAPVTGFDAFKSEVAKLAGQMQKELEDQKIVIPRPDDTQFIDGLQEASLTYLQIWLEVNKEVLNTSQNLFNDLAGLTQQLTETRIAEIEKVTDAQLEAIDIEEAALKDQIKKRRISETEAERLTEQLTKQRLAVQADADKKERAIKKKQFDIDKAAALIEIAINTAVAVTENLGIPILAAAIALAGAAEGAAVASKPNPYEKGTKHAKPGLAVVDEKGSEAILRVKKGRITTLDEGDKVITHAKTKKFAKVFDSIADDTFDQYIFKTYITPQLQAQKEKFVQAKEKSLAANITKSMVINNMTNGKGDFYLERMEKKGIIIRNLGDLAPEKPDIYRSR